MALPALAAHVSYQAQLNRLLAAIAREQLRTALEIVGCALLGHRTKNPYVHLACGGLIFLLASAIPKIGTLVVLAVGLTAFGSLVATRAAGLLPVKGRAGSGGPYRTPSHGQDAA